MLGLSVAMARSSSDGSVIRDVLRCGFVDDDVMFVHSRPGKGDAN